MMTTQPTPRLDDDDDLDDLDDLDDAGGARLARDGRLPASGAPTDTPRTGHPPEPDPPRWGWSPAGGSQPGWAPGGVGAVAVEYRYFWK